MIRQREERWRLRESDILHVSSTKDKPEFLKELNFGRLKAKYLWGRVGSRVHRQRFFVLPVFVRPGCDQLFESSLKEVFLQVFFVGPHGIILVIRVLA